MKNFQIIFLASSLCLLSGCDSIEKTVKECVRLLDEADLLLESREFQPAYTKASLARQELLPLLDKDTKYTDTKMLFCRASLTAFFAMNTPVIEQALPRPKSLVCLPDVGAYENYSELLSEPTSILNELLSTPEKLSLEERQAAYASLATIQRLSLATLPEAVDAYIHALAVLQERLLLARGEIKGTVFTKMVPFKEQNLLTEQRFFQLSLVEVYLAQEKWTDALLQLKEMSGGDDLNYFVTQWRMLENNIADLQRKLQEEFNKTKEGEKLPTAAISKELAEKQAQDPSKLNAIGHYSIHEVALMEMDLELTNIKNQLIYRAICYYNLEMKKEFQQSLQIISAEDSQLAETIKHDLAGSKK